ncbi:MAG: DUF1501 domain-containing protein [Alphaproteobacteria bacterium]|nr:DUF1501 domain-containing protein [Alphaproteobacteria bacterium]
MTGGARISRRSALAGLAAAAAAPWAGVRVGFAQTGAAGPGDAGPARLALVLLRGGLDGLALLPPHGDPSYRTVRGRLALPAPGGVGGVIDLDGTFGLHPAALGLLRFWSAGRLAVAPAAAGPYRGTEGVMRHADARRAFATGTARPDGPGAESGWLNRALARAGGGPPALALAGAGVPAVLAGPVAAQAAAQAAPPAVLGAPVRGLMQKAALLYQGDALLGPALAQAARRRARPAESLGAAHVAEADAGARSPFELAAAAHHAGRRLAEPGGPRVAVIEAAGFDSHFGPVHRTERRIAALAGGLAALADGLGEAFAETVILAASEFGRAAAPNAAGGTDHGLAGPLLLLGGPVQGGIKGAWPGLAAERLAPNGGVAPSLDARAVLKAVLAGHWGLNGAQLDAVFPDARTVAPAAGLLRRG